MARVGAVVSQGHSSAVAHSSSPNSVTLGTNSSLPASSQNSPEAPPRQPTEPLQVEEPNEEDIDYPQGPQLWLNMVSVILVSFLHGLDLTIVAVVIPKLTDDFKTLNDIGWYSAVYGLILSATCFIFGKLYTLFPLKTIYIISVAIFEIGSLLCTVAPTSHAFILGRALAGLGIGGQGAGARIIIPRCFPNSKRPMVNGVLGFAQSVGLVSAPIIGGALTDALSWRACFGINIPLGIIAIVITIFCMTDPVPNPNLQLPIRTKLKQLDLFGTALIVPAIVCLMLGLQWGGIRYGWNNWRIILVLVLFVGLIAVFAYSQHQLQEDGVLPPRIIKNRTVMASTLFICCSNGLLAVTEYYISIYFQGVRGLSASRAGVLGVPMIAGLALSSIVAAIGTTWIGYYSRILTPVASGILTTIELGTGTWKVAGLLGFVGLAIGCGLQAPVNAVMTLIPLKDMSIAMGALTFGSGIGSSLSVAAAAALFQARLDTELSQRLPDVNISSIDTAGLTDLRQFIGEDRLTIALSGYNEAVVQTLYMPLALGVLCLVGALFTEHKPISKRN